MQSILDYSAPAFDQFHGHDVLEMNFLLTGRALHRIGDVELTAGAGDLGVAHYGQQHALLAEGVEVFNIYLDPQNHALPSLPPAMSESLAMLLPLHPNMGHRHNRLVTLHLDPLEPVRELLYLMEGEQATASQGSDQALLAYLQVFLIHCARAIQQGGIEAPPVGRGYEVYERARRRLEVEWLDPPALTGLAREAGCSPNYFCTRFREYTGLPPQQYVLNRRLQRAMALLRSSDEKILAIAYESGFRDLAYFNRKFKALIGQTPRQYREQFVK